MPKQKSIVKASTLTFDEIRNKATELEDQFIARNTLYTDLEKMYAMDWSDKPKDQFVKATMSPEPHNVVNTIARILSTTEPAFNVKPNADSESSRKNADKFEVAMREMARRSNEQQNEDSLRELVMSLSIFGEAVLKIADLRPGKFYRGKKDAFENFPQNLTPIVFKVLHPSQVFYERADYGLAVVVEKRERTVGDVRRSWGDRAGELVTRRDSDTVTFYEYWDYTPFGETGTRCVWCDEMRAPILEPVEHGFDFLPYTVRSANAVAFLSDPAYRNVSMLYPLHKGAIWQRQNLMLSVIATNVQLFANPKWVSKTGDGRAISIDFNMPGGNIPLRAGETIEPLMRQLVPREVYDLVTLLGRMSEESTIPRVVSGASPGGVSAGFAINLLAQGGKLAIYPIEQAASALMSDATQIALAWIENGKFPVNLGGGMEITPDDAKKYRYAIDVKLRAAMPQDKIATGSLWNQIINAGWGDPRTAWEEMGYSNASEMMDRLLEWVFIRKNIDEFAEEKRDEFDATRKPKAKPGLPSSVLPPVMQNGQPPAPPELAAMMAQAQMAQTQQPPTPEYGATTAD